MVSYKGFTTTTEPEKRHVENDSADVQGMHVPPSLGTDASSPLLHCAPVRLRSSMPTRRRRTYQSRRTDLSDGADREPTKSRVRWVQSGTAAQWFTASSIESTFAYSAYANVRILSRHGRAEISHQESGRRAQSNLISENGHFGDGQGKRLHSHN